MIDLHCHVIPGVDDGPATIADSLALGRAAAAAGTVRVIATPHVSWDYPGVDADAVRRGVAAVNRALVEASIALEVDPGAEIAVSRAGDIPDDEIARLRLGGGSYSLIECPHHGGAPTAIEAMLRGLIARGQWILLAHPERCPVFQSNRGLLPRLAEAGMLSCITARSLTGDFGSTAHAYAWELMAAGQVHAIASDAHDVARRPPDLGPTLERAGLTAAQIEHFASAAPHAILTGAPVPGPLTVERERPRRWRARLRRHSGQ